MKDSRDLDDGPGEPRGEELLAALLEGREPDADVDAAELAAWSASLERIRAKVRGELRGDGDWSPIREGALVGRVLARTSREDLGWRGDARLFGGFLRERLAASPLLRVVAASLALHVAALPVLGFLMYREARPFRIELRAPLEDRADLLDESSEPLPEERDLGTAHELDGPPRDRIENALRRALHRLSTLDYAGVTRPEDSAGAGPSSPLQARLNLLARRSVVGPVPDAPELLLGPPTEATSDLELLFAGELLLDGLVVNGERPQDLTAVLGEIDRRRGDSELAGLLGGVLDRARAYGAWEADAEFDPAAVARPLDPDWFERVERAVGDDPVPDRPLRDLPSWRALRRLAGE